MVRRRLVHIILVSLAVVLMTACDKFHMSDNGLLDGNWQLTQVDTLQTGQTADVRQRLIFWAVQTDLLQMRAHNHLSVFFRFRYDGSTLTLTDPVADKREISDSIITDVRSVNIFGMSHLAATLQVQQLTGSRMTLQSDSLRLHFRKY